MIAGLWVETLNQSLPNAKQDLNTDYTDYHFNLLVSETDTANIFVR